MFINDSNDAVCQGRRPGALTRLCTLRTRARLRSRRARPTVAEAASREVVSRRRPFPSPSGGVRALLRPRRRCRPPPRCRRTRRSPSFFAASASTRSNIQFIFIAALARGPGVTAAFSAPPPPPHGAGGGGGIKCGSSVACLHKSGNVAVPVTERCPPVARPALQSIKLPTGASGHGSRGGGLLRLRPVSSPPSAPVSGSGASLMHTHDRCRRPRSSILACVHTHTHTQGPPQQDVRAASPAAPSSAANRVFRK